MVAQKEEMNVVGDQRNWEQRVMSELHVAKVWCENWGSLYEGSATQEQQISALEEALKRMPSDQRTRTNYQLSFTAEKGFDEYPVGPMQRKTIKAEDVRKLVQEMITAQQSRTLVARSPTSEEVGSDTPAA